MGRRAGIGAARGDYPTPASLAAAVCERVALLCPAPAAVVETSCGRGNLLLAASRRFPAAELFGYELDDEHLAVARERLPPTARLRRADFFSQPWEVEARRWSSPTLVLGNPPWITVADLARLGSGNAPARVRPPTLSGFDARTGKSNFDVSEWMVCRLLDCLAQRSACVAMILKTAVARRVIARVLAAPAAAIELQLVHLDARAEFGVAVDACLLLARLGARARATARGECEVFADLGSREAVTRWGLCGGQLVGDVEGWSQVSGLVDGVASPWRSGLKHDCAEVMELEHVGGELRNRGGEVAEVDAQQVFPLLKAQDLAHGRVEARRRLVLVPQRALGEATEPLRDSAPATWRYLCAHGERLDARRSRVYAGRPRFAIFGIGDYAFAPWKVCVSGLHHPARFVLVGPVAGRPVMLDDTCYYLGFAERDEALHAYEILSSELTREVLRALVFTAAKRPITKAILTRLDLSRLAEALAARGSGADSRVAGFAPGRAATTTI